MAYTRPPGNNVGFTFSGLAYTRPAGNAVNFQWLSEFYATGAVTVEPSADGTGAHGVAATGAVTADPSADGAGTFTTINIEGSGAVTVDGPAAAGQAQHGVAGAGASNIEFGADGASGHGVAGFLADTTVGFASSGSGAHGVAGSGAATIAGHNATGQATHERYELRGEVRDGGILVNRRVRAYLRATGALIGEADTVAGRFQIAAGFAPAEHYLIPIDLTAGAVDWSPPAANRVVSVLAFDT